MILEFRRQGLLLTGVLLVSAPLCHAKAFMPWMLSPAEYAAARAVSAMQGTPCEIVSVLSINNGTSCGRDDERYGKQILKEFQKAQDAINDSAFTSRDYESAWSSNYPEDKSEPGYTYAACSIAYAQVYVGETLDGESLAPNYLVCTRSMVNYGKHIIDQFSVAIKAELRPD